MSLGAGNGDAVYGLSVHGPGNEDDEVHFSFRASDTLVSNDDGTVGSVRETRIAYVDWSSVDFVSVFIPTVVETTLDWIPAVYEQTFKVPILDATPAKTLPLSVAVYGEVIGAASVGSWHTAYIGASGDYISQNGYQYLGYALAVPEPADYTLMLAGLALLAVVGRSRHCNVTGGSAA